MLFLLYTVHVIICIFLILVILLQQGSGADLSVFGGGGTQTAFGARGATQVIHKLTVWGFVGFIVLTFGIALLQGSRNRSSVMSGVEQAQAESEEAVEEPVTEAPSDGAVNEPVAPATGPADAAAEPSDDPSATDGDDAVEATDAATDTAAANPESTDS